VPDEPEPPEPEYFPRCEQGKTDKGGPDAPPKPCCKRVDTPLGWCVLDDGHEGSCAAMQPRSIMDAHGTLPDPVKSSMIGNDSRNKPRK
jgi:hypothetical protein